MPPALSQAQLTAPRTLSSRIPAAGRGTCFSSRLFLLDCKRTKEDSHHDSRRPGTPLSRARASASNSCGAIFDVPRHRAAARRTRSARPPSPTSGRTRKRPSAFCSSARPPSSASPPRKSSPRMPATSTPTSIWPRKRPMRRSASRSCATSIANSPPPMNTSRSSKPTRCSPAKATASTPSSPSSPAPAAPSRRTGPRCFCACTCAGPSARASAPR